MSCDDLKKIYNKNLLPDRYLCGKGSVGGYLKSLYYNLIKLLYPLKKYPIMYWLSIKVTYTNF